MSLLPTSMKWIRSRKAKKRVHTVFPIISLWVFFRRSRAADSAAGGRICLNFIVIGLLVAEILMFENVDEVDNVQIYDENGQMPDHGYPLSSPMFPFSGSTLFF